MIFFEFVGQGLVKDAKRVKREMLVKEVFSEYVVRCCSMALLVK